MRRLRNGSVADRKAAAAAAAAIAGAVAAQAAVAGEATVVLVEEVRVPRTNAGTFFRLQQTQLLLPLTSP